MTMRFLQKIIYYACYWLYKVIMKVRHPKIKALWYRNSFCFDYWVFLKSDIDVTIVFKKADKKLIQAVSETHCLFRRFFPVIGELVIFSESHKESLLSCVNSYELKRDVFLLKKYPIVKKEDAHDKIIFLHKFIAANWSKKNIDNERPEKISFISKYLQIEEIRHFLDLIDVLANLIGVDQVQFKKDYIMEMNKREKNFLYHDFVISNLIYALFYNNLCYLTPKQPLNEIEKKIVEKNILWELWGAFSYQTTIVSDDLKKHQYRLASGLHQLVSLDFATEHMLLSKELNL